jgi:hypothetical protein
MTLTWREDYLPRVAKSAMREAAIDSAERVE